MRQNAGTERIWARHSRMTEPANLGAAIAGLPASIAALNAVVQGVLLHSDSLAEHGLNRPAVWSRTTLPVSDRLAEIFSKDPRPLQSVRRPEARAIGTCRDFAVLLCSFLRSKGIPARMRCGFASYFGSHWEDHWVCEYWGGVTDGWRLSDAQIDDVLRDLFGIGFDSSDMPREYFMTAGEAWQRCRAGMADPTEYGHHGEAAGLWFMKVNVARDHYVLNGHETSTWDRWREASEAARVVAPQEISLLDDLARRPDQALRPITPEWLA